MVVIPGGNKDLRAAVGEKLPQGIKRIAVDAGAVKQVAGEQHGVASVRTAQAAQRLQGKALLLPPPRRTICGQRGKGGIQMEVRRVQQSNHAGSPFLRRYSGRCVCQW